MRQPSFVHGLHNVRAVHRGGVLTIGSFDGVHRGHQAMLASVIEAARARGVPAVAMTFEPQPHEYFSGERAPARLMRLRDKVLALYEVGIDVVVCLPFNAKLQHLTAHQFVQQVLVDGLAISALVIGDDFRFGCDRLGDFAFLQAAGAEAGFSVRNTPTFSEGGERVSSTRIREVLEQGDLQMAAQLLGRPYQMTGRVVQGKQLGRTIGVPTANVHLHRYRSPLAGVFAVRCEVDGSSYIGVANVGVRPTVEEGAKPILEVHLFDFKRDIYGKNLCVSFCKKLRDEQKFESLAQLQAQIHADIAAGKSFFNELTHSH
ncbi:bifunctional riboflavin kinase/FAD synthetase [Simiduia sp. 21SJ11W-1]|uniref:bifunctional riboflavin kinase/FAD synthetase n=1 Tax=Simiduia sp. 21SJ11W-1 TaxID=2909669 RepID=UPI00209FDE23|nr:bifunctional riboflavin kinase/FAD synthetase [Simiduia sp. 21SJ11W-1]UTA47341.1 bifunctional riboflavin kinase/FAD synthetase [Simiduia sp. 21SJ11W-1]